MPTKKKNKSLSGEDKKLIEEIIRVDHAGMEQHKYIVDN